MSILRLHRLALPKLLMGAVRPRVLACLPMEEVGPELLEAGPGERTKAPPCACAFETKIFSACARLLVPKP